MVAGSSIALLLVAAACRPPMPTTELRWREERSEAIRAELPEAARGRFEGLAFYPWKPDYRLRTIMEPVVPPEPLTIAASNGEMRPAHRIGRVRLDLSGSQVILAIYHLDELKARYPDELFLPFRDAGAGRETYGAGRYVDVERLSGGVVQIDFNRAYNPDCAYGIAGRCPITPEENTIRVAVRAGEKLPPGHG